VRSTLGSGKRPVTLWPNSAKTLTEALFVK
jgi:hypothetical protein